jgi:hypothetical protein
MTVARYAVIRYLPDPLREEHLNVGVVVITDDGSFKGCRFVSDWRRARYFGRRDVSFLKDFAGEFTAAASLQLQLPGLEHLDSQKLEALAVNWQNAIRFSEVRASVAPDPRALLNRLFEQYVGGERREPARARDKRAVLGAAQATLMRELDRRFPQSTPTIIRYDSLEGAHGPADFDLVVRNGRPLMGIEALSFEVPRSKELSNQISAAAWAISDVRQRDPGFPLAVVVLPPRARRDDFDRATGIYKDLGADVVTDEQIPDWAPGAADRIAAAAPEARGLLR